MRLKIKIKIRRLGAWSPGRVPLLPHKYRNLGSIPIAEKNSTGKRMSYPVAIGDGADITSPRRLPHSLALCPLGSAGLQGLACEEFECVLPSSGELGG